MYQAGEVDYLVATDAIGMGLNMDVAHVAFASLRKFDGRRQRRLTVAEMAQIAGRAGRHQRDGSFGTLGLEGGGGAMFDPEEVMQIEGHHFAPLDHLYWRDGAPDMGSVDRLIAGLERRPDRPGLRAAPEAVDLAVLKRVSAEPLVTQRARGTAMVARLWAACGLPDFRKTGAETHSRLVARVFGHLSEGSGRLPVDWFAAELARLDIVTGDVETLADRIAAARTWSYIAHRPDWLADPEHWAGRTRALEEKLSDALHDRLTQRFVDRRTTVLMRDLAARGADALPVAVTEEGAVSVGGEPIGRLSGFRFVAEEQARHDDLKRMMAAAERRLSPERTRRAERLAADPDDCFTLATEPGRPVALFWRGEVVARLAKGRTLLTPTVTLHRSLEALTVAERETVAARLRRWLSDGIARHLRPLPRIAAAAGDLATPGPLRALLAPLAEAGGIVAREALAPAIAGLDREHRRAAGKFGVKIGALDIFAEPLLKPEAMRWRLALIAARAGRDAFALPPAGAVVLPANGMAAAGYRPIGGQLVRVDLVERLARTAHDARDGRRPFVPDPSLATSLGLTADTVGRLMRLLGFLGTAEGWIWRGRAPKAPTPARPGSAFGSLGGMIAARG
jgi:ATP-dependent RNA helicase SUPV3L1/SUV3